MKKKKSKKKKESFAGDGTALSTLGEALQQTNPEVAQKFQEIQSSVHAAERLVEVVNDVLPFNWTDSELFEEGVRLAAEGQYQEAAEVLEEVIRYYPDAYPAYHLLGYVCGCRKNYKDETENYRKAIKIRSDYSQVHYDMGVACWLMGREKRAFVSFQKTVSMTSEFAVTDYWMSFTFERMGRYRSGGTAGKKRMREKRRVMAEICLMIGKAYLEDGLHISARHAFKKAVGISPEFAEAYYQLGSMHIKKLRNPKRAAKYLENAEQLFIKKNNLQRAAMAHQLYHPIEDVKEKEKAADVWLKEGLRLQQLGMYQGAVDAYKVAVSLKPDFVDAYYNMGVAYGSLEERGVLPIHKAIWALKQAVSIKPDFVHALIALGASYIKNQELEGAVETLEEALKCDPREPDGAYYLGIAHRMSGRLPEAVDVLKKAAALRPDSVQARFYLGLALIDSECFQEACDAFNEALRIKPDFADGHYMLGNLYLEKIRETEKALIHLRKAEKLFAKLEDFQRAAQVRHILSLHPN